MAGKKLSTSELHGNVQTYLMSCVRALLLSLPAFSTTRTLSSKSFNCLNDPVSNSVKFFTNGLKITIQRLRHWDALRFLLCHDLSIFLHFNLGLNLRTSLLTCKDCKATLNSCWIFIICSRIPLFDDSCCPSLWSSCSTFLSEFTKDFEDCGEGLVFSYPARDYLSVTSILCDRMTDTVTLITSLIDVDSLTERRVTSAPATWHGADVVNQSWFPGRHKDLNTGHLHHTSHITHQTS